MPSSSSAAEARHWERELDGVASLVGYDAFLEITATCMRLMLTALQGSTFEPGSESERSCLSFLCDLCDDAVSLIILPRVPNCGTPMESAVLMRLPGFPAALQPGPVHQEWRNRIMRAYARLCQSSVADARGLNGQPAADALTTAIMNKARSDMARSAAAAAGKLRSCALGSCSVTEALCVALQGLRRMQDRRVLLQRAPGGGLAGPQSRMQGGAQAYGVQRRSVTRMLRSVTPKCTQTLRV